jgi:Na+-transporting NADH:ubiquinone oxidoreductase subunit NqrD
MTWKILGREPALWLAVVAAGLGLLVTFNLPWMNADQAGLWVAGVNAVFGVVTAVLTRPVAPAAFTTLVTAGSALLTAYGLDLDPQTVGAVNTLVVAALFLITREQVSPQQTTLTHA